MFHTAREAILESRSIHLALASRSKIALKYFGQSLNNSRPLLPMKNLSVHLTKLLFATLFLVLVLSTSSFAGLTPESEIQRKTREEAQAQQKAALEQHQRDATDLNNGVGASNSNFTEKGRVRFSAIDLMFLNNASQRKKTSAEIAVEQAKQRKRAAQQQNQNSVPPGVTIRNGEKKSATPADIIPPVLAIEQQTIVNTAAVKAMPTSIIEQQQQFNANLQEIRSLPFIVGDSQPELEIPLAVPALETPIKTNAALTEKKEEPGSLTREEFLNLLTDDLVDWESQLKVESLSEEATSNVKVLILQRAINTASRLIEKFRSESVSSKVFYSKDQEMLLPSIRKLQESIRNKSVPTAFPKIKMTPLAFHEEFYNEIKDATQDALKCITSDEMDSALDSLDDINYLDSYAQLIFNDDPLLQPIITKLRENYESLFVKAVTLGERRARVSLRRKTVDNNNIKLWDFESSIEENKLLLKQAFLSLTGTGSLSSLIKAGNTPRFIEKNGRNILQLTASIKQKAVSFSIPEHRISEDKISEDRISEGASLKESSKNFLNASETSETRETSFISQPNFYRSFTLGSIVLLAAALFYEWYIHFLQTSA